MVMPIAQCSHEHEFARAQLEHVSLTAELKAVDAQLRKLKKAGKAGAAQGKDSNSNSNSSSNSNSEASPNGQVSAMQTPEEITNNLFYRPLPMPGLPYLQSSRLENPTGVNGLSKNLIKKMNLILNELGITRPTPTKVVMDMYDKLRKSIVMLLSLQKVATKKEQQVWQEKKIINQEMIH